MIIKEITILQGFGKNNEKDQLEKITMKMGDVISIVGPTGSGKTSLINDIALFANNNTPSRRTILINGTIPPDEFIQDPSKNPIALITQHTNFLSDLPVYKFLEYHAKIRNNKFIKLIIDETLEFANQ